MVELDLICSRVKREHVLKLISLPHSPYAARVRMQIRKKALDIDIVAPPVPLRTEDFRSQFPLAKVPILVGRGNTKIPEATAIMEYLEDAFPAVPCRPKDPLDLALMRATVSAVNSHLGPSLFSLFSNLKKPPEGEGLTLLFEPVLLELAKLDRWLSVRGAVEECDIADFCLASSLWYVAELADIFGFSNIFEAYGNVEQLWKHYRRSDLMEVEFVQMKHGFSGFIQRIQAQE